MGKSYKVDRFKIFFYPILSGLIIIMGLLSIIWIGSYIGDSISLRNEHLTSLRKDSLTLTDRQVLEENISEESWNIARDILILITIFVSASSSSTLMLVGAIAVFNDPLYIQQRNAEKRDKYSKMLNHLHSGTTAPKAPPASSVYPAAPAAPKPIAKPPGPSGRPIIKSSKSPLIAPPPAPKPSVTPPARVAPTVASAPAPAPTAPPPVPDEFPHEFPDIPPEDAMVSYDDLY